MEIRESLDVKAENVSESNVSISPRSTSICVSKKVRDGLVKIVSLKGSDLRREYSVNIETSSVRIKAFDGGCGFFAIARGTGRDCKEIIYDSSNNRLEEHVSNVGMTSKFFSGQGEYILVRGREKNYKYGVFNVLRQPPIDISTYKSDNLPANIRNFDVSSLNSCILQFSDSRSFEEIDIKSNAVDSSAQGTTRYSPEEFDHDSKYTHFFSGDDIYSLRKKYMDGYEIHKISKVGKSVKSSKILDVGVEVLNPTIESMKNISVITSSNSVLIFDSLKEDIIFEKEYDNEFFVSSYLDGKEVYISVKKGFGGRSFLELVSTESGVMKDSQDDIGIIDFNNGTALLRRQSDVLVTY